MLLCLAVQAGNFPGSGTSDVAQEELEALWTNVKVILAGLQAYGQMWDGIDLMACKLPTSCRYLHFLILVIQPKSRLHSRRLLNCLLKSHLRIP